MQLILDMSGLNQGRKISNRTITISIMQRINNDLEKEIFLKTLEDKIYSELNLIN